MNCQLLPFVKYVWNLGFVEAKDIERENIGKENEVKVKEIL